MYQIDHLLALLTDEKAKELQFRPGSSPVMVSEQEMHSLQGPPITDEDAMRLLRGLATSRQMRDLRERGAVQFVYTAPGRTPFLIRRKWMPRASYLTYHRQADGLVYSVMRSERRDRIRRTTVPIPKELRPPPQGCEVGQSGSDRATLGPLQPDVANPNGVVLPFAAP